MFSWLKDRAEDAFDLSRRHWTQAAVPLAIALLAGLVVQSPFQSVSPVYRPGEIARSDIKAPAKMLVVDEDLTHKRQARAAETINDVYDYDSQLAQQLSARVTRAFDTARQELNKKSEAGIIAAFKELLGVNITQEDAQRIYKSGFQRRVQKALEIYLGAAFNHWITDKPIDPQDESKSFSVRDLFTENEVILSGKDFESQVLSLEQVRDKIAKDPIVEQKLVRLIPTDLKISILNLAQELLSSDLSYNQIESSARREEAKKRIEPAVVEIAKGEMIIREGERVERKHLLLLDALKNLQETRTDLTSYIGFVVLLFVLIFVLYGIGTKNFKRFRLSAKDHLVLGGFFIISIALIAGLNTTFEAALSRSLGGHPVHMLLPFAFVGMSLRLFTSIEIVFFFSILFATCVAWLLKDPFMARTSLIVSITGAAAMRHITLRMDVLRAGFIAGLVQSILVCLGVVMGLTESTGLESQWIDLAATFGLALASGILAAGMCMFTQPLIEFLGYTTDLRLMELSNTNHPLLRELIISAPGTYFHSFAVSQLSEKAAEAINANPLFARVASLYHDIGKLKKPQYFIENIQGENRHDKLVPSMSALIISNHVKEGIDIAQSHKLPRAIVDCIPQHHGTALISYFYDKAKQNVAEGEEVDERDFRYPGPKPQTKEAAIIMLADAVEATAKSMSHASLDQLKQRVNQTIRRFFLDGQLDECELTLKDLNAIGNAFVNVLQGIYHQRIDYPHLQKGPSDDNDDDDEHSTIGSVVKRASTKRP